MEIKELSNYSFGKQAQKEKMQKEKIIKPTFMQKNLSSLIDMGIVFVIRFLATSILAFLWYSFRLKDVFSTLDFAKDTQEHIFSVLVRFGILYEFVVFAVVIILTGGLYYVIMFSSKWGATFGCKIMDLKIVNRKTGGYISFLRSFARYLLCLVPLFFLTLILYKFYTKDVDITVIFLVLLSAFWYDLSTVFRINRGVPDIISGTILVSTRPPKKPSGVKL